VVIKSTSGPWIVRQRFLSSGTDQPLAGRFNFNNTVKSLALVADRTGTTMVAVQPDGQPELNARYFDRSPFGALEGPSGTGGSVNPETGFGGATTPNQSGGFTYLRNRWYDPQTGRFLTQDPIGLAGGVNLYAYAGNNPVANSDPFGLKCEGRGNCTQSDGGVIAQGDAAEKEWMAYENAQTMAVLRGGLGILHDLVYSCGEMPCVSPVRASAPEINVPYSRPSGATTAAQRASVQGQPCAICGESAERMVAGHKRALVVEYYKTGTVDIKAARSLEAVRPECPTCSAREGARLSVYARIQRFLLGFDY
jgi:RHS repeat-associated protein